MLVAIPLLLLVLFPALSPAGERITDEALRMDLPFDSSHRPCGTSGSSLDRMKDCASIRKYDGSAFDPKGWPWETILTFKAWGLVMRTREGSEFWKDLQTGVIWLKPWPDAMDRESAEIFCGLLGDSTVWDDPARLGTEWALPSKSDYRTAESHGIRRVLNLWPGDLFWTSSLTGWTSEPLVFDQRTGDTHNDLRPDRKAFVQCVLR